MHEAEALQFGFVDQIQAPAKSGAVAAFRERLRDLELMQQKVGGIVPQILAAGVLGVSKQRVGYLIETGRLETVMIHETPYVTMRSLVEFGESERKSGRPLKKPTLGEIVKSSIDVGKAIYDQRRKTRKNS